MEELAQETPPMGAVAGETRVGKLAVVRPVE